MELRRDQKPEERTCVNMRFDLVPRLGLTLGSVSMRSSFHMFACSLALRTAKSPKTRTKILFLNQISTTSCAYLPAKLKLLGTKIALSCTGPEPFSVTQNLPLELGPKGRVMRDGATIRAAKKPQVCTFLQPKYCVVLQFLFILNHSYASHPLKPAQTPCVLNEYQNLIPEPSMRYRNTAFWESHQGNARLANPAKYEPFGTSCMMRDFSSKLGCDT